MKLAVTKLVNGIKRQQEFNIYQYIGVFRVSAFRNILDRLIFNDEYKKIDSNLTNRNDVGRKGRNIRDNIFVLNAIINSIKKGN